MPSLRRKRPSTIPKPTGTLPAGTDHVDWCSPVEDLLVGFRVLQMGTFVHVSDPMVADAPHLFRRCSDNQPVGPPPQPSSLARAGF